MKFDSHSQKTAHTPSPLGGEKAGVRGEIKSNAFKIFVNHLQFVPPLILNPSPLRGEKEADNSTSNRIPLASLEGQFRDAGFIEFAQAEFYHLVVLLFRRGGEREI